MDQQQKIIQEYQTIIGESFEKIKKNLPKKYSGIKDFIQKQQNFAKSDGINQLDANKYYIVFKLALNIKSAKLLEASLKAISSLISNGFLTGNCLDNTNEYHLEEYKDLLNYTNQSVNGGQRYLVETIIDDIISCNNDKDELTQTHIIKILVQLSTHYKIDVHSQLLVKVITTLVNIYTSTKNMQIQNISKQSIFQITCHVFKRLEEVEGAENQLKTMLEQQIKQSKQQKQKKGNQPKNIEEFISPRRQSQKDICLTEDFWQQYCNITHTQKLQNKPSIDTVCLDALTNIVDNVCLYQEKTKIVTQNLKDADQQTLQAELENIPLNPVPFNFSQEDPKYFQTIQTNAQNEAGQIAGKFGWCINCRQSADLYCKDNRLPVCSNECKQKYKEVLYIVSKNYQEYSLISSMCINDAQIIFKLFCEFVQQQPDTNAKSYLIAKEMNQKQKLMVLEMLNHTLNSYKSFFLKNKEQQYLIRTDLIGGLYTCCLNSDQEIFIYAVNIFWIIVANFKETLKNEIAIFIQEIFLKLLNSNNSQHPHREMSLKVLRMIFNKNQNLLEFFINYDCSEDNAPLVELILDTLFKIGGGYYQDQQFQLVLTQQQQLSLQQLAIQALSSTVQSISLILDNFEKDRVLNEKEEMKNSHNLDETLVDLQSDTYKELPKFETNDPLEKQRIQKIQFQTAIKKFNQKPKNGLKYMMQLGIIPKNDNAVEISNFLKMKNIDQEKIGEYIGGHDQLNIDVLQNYTFSQDFKGLNIEQALRKYLQTFQLPGEAQQVDRIVQKFGEKFHQDNPTAFNSSDGVYTLAYLLIMLQTDQHNPQVENKMSFTQFMNLAKPIEGEVFEEATMKAIYNAIKEKPLAIPQKQQEEQALQNSIQTSLRKKRDMFQQETKQMLERGQQLINKNNKISIYYKVNQNSIYYIKPIMETFSKKLLQSFKTGFLDGEPKIIDKSIEGFVNCIKLTSYFGLHEEKDQFMEQLFKFSNLQPNVNNINQIDFKKKQFKCVKSIIDISNSFTSQNLKKSWIYVLQTLSYLDSLKLLGNIEEYKEDKQNDGEVKIISAQFQREQSEQFYSKSHLLDNESIFYYIEALCKVSQEEQNNTSNPRIYSLQKCLEAATTNMSRINIVWNKIWKIIRDHFTEVGTNKNEEIAKSGIKFLTHLCFKFLQADKFQEENFKAQLQKEFLKPYENIFANLNIQDSQIKIYILECIKIISSKYHSQLKSGWRIIFNVINFALNEEDENISQRAYLILKDIMEANLNNIDDVFLDLVSSLKKLSKKRTENLAFASIAHVKRCLVYLSEKEQIKPRSELDNKNNDKNLNQSQIKLTQSLEEHWMPLLDVLSNLCGDNRATIQENAMETLFQILESYGYCFSVDFWKMIFQGVLRPLFDEIIFTVQNNQQKQSHLNWLKKSCQNAFLYITNLMDIYFDNLKNLIKELIKTYEGCIQNANESVVKVAINSLRHTLLKIGNKFTKEDWDIVIQFFERIFKITTPFKLVNKQNGLLTQQINDGNNVSIQKKSQSEFKFNCEECVTQCVAQLLLISVVKDITDMYIDYLDKEHLITLQQILGKSYDFAREFNTQLEIRFYLWKNGFMEDMKQLPGLLKQEREAQACQLILQFHSYRKYEDTENREDLLNSLLDSIIKYIKLFIELHEDLIMLARETQNQENFADQIIQRPLNQINQQEFPEILNRLDDLESERDTINLRTLITQTVLPILDELEQDEIQPKISEIVDLLIDMTKYQQSKCMACLTCPLCKNCQKCDLNNDQQLDTILRPLIKKLFVFNSQLQTIQTGNRESRGSILQRQQDLQQQNGINIQNQNMSTNQNEQLKFFQQLDEQNRQQQQLQQKLQEQQELNDQSNNSNQEQEYNNNEDNQ